MNRPATAAPLLALLALAAAASARAQPVSAPSTIWVPVQVDLAPLLADLERELPDHVDAMGAWTMTAGDRVGLKYDVRRSPIALGLSGDTLTATATLDYEAMACVRIKKPWPLRGYICPSIASCGQGEPRRQMTVRISTRLGWAPRWHLTSQSRAELAFPSRCELTAFRVDVTRHIERRIRAQLEQALGRLDARVREATDVREQAQRTWDALATPRQVEPSTWLLLTPEEVRAAPVDGAATTVRTALGLVARPVLRADRPAAAPTPLPEIRLDPAQHEFHVAVDVQLPFSDASRLLSQKVVGQTFQAAGRTVSVFEASVVRGEQRAAVVVLGLRLPPLAGEEAEEVRLRLWGWPSLDPTGTSVRIQDLEYALDDASIRLRQLDALAHQALREWLAQRAQWDMAPALGEARATLQKALECAQIEGLHLGSSVPALEVRGVSADAQGFTLALHAGGSVDATFTPAAL